MYTKKLIPLFQEDIKKVNATVLASTFNVSQSYASRILNSDKPPTSKTGKKILISARVILDAYDSLIELMATNEAVSRDSIKILAETYIVEAFIETTILDSKFGRLGLNDVLVNFYRYVDNWMKNK